MRDVRLLRDHLLAEENWDRAASGFANDHDRFFERMLRLGAMRAELLFATGPEAEARRKRGFAAQRADPSVIPDTLGLGPDAACDDLARARYFGEA